MDGQDFNILDHNLYCMLSMVQISMTPAGSSDLPAGLRSSFEKIRSLSGYAPEGPMHLGCIRICSLSTFAK